jgi:hypothetical protein
MADETEGGFQVAGLFHSLFGQFINLIISNNVCVSSNFVDGVIVMRFCQHIYYSGYEEFVWVVVLRGWVLDVVEEEIYDV